MNKKIYLQQLIREFPRLLSLQDRDPYSLTYGCFDRTYWGWKFKDFADITLQRAVYSLALVYSHDFEGNQYFQNKKLKEWIKAGIFYWIKKQHRNGSIDQAFPNEFSFGATAFTLGPLISSYLIIKKELSNQEQEQVLQAFKKASKFLLKGKETHGFISNHLAGAALSLYKAGLLFENQDYQKRAQKIINLILKNQSSEGWFQEYEGPDPGYETLGLSYLAQYYEQTKDKNVLDALVKSIEFLSYFIHPDGTLGGEYGSRNTEIFYPVGLEIIKNKIPLAQSILNHIEESIQECKTISLNSVDKENLVPLMENYLLAYLSEKDNEDNGIKLPFEQNKIEKYFNQSGLFIKGNENYYLICNVFKGGVIKIFDQKKKYLIWDDCGHIGQTDQNHVLTTQIFNPKTNIKLLEKNSLKIETIFMGTPQQLPSPFRTIILRIINLSICQNVFLGNLFKNALIKLLITQKKKYPVKLKREINWGEKQIKINDVLIKEPGFKFKYLDYGKKFSAIHMGSSKYFQPSQLEDRLKPSELDLEKFNQENKIIIENKIKF